VALPLQGPLQAYILEQKKNEQTRRLMALKKWRPF